MMATSSTSHAAGADAIDIRAAVVPDDLPVARTLFREYADGLGVDLSFQDFDAELDALPGKYAPPPGRLLIAWRGAEAVGCIALRPLADGDCEMKRLYVRPAARGQDLGRRLVARICGEARGAGYARICLDTLPMMRAAVTLYRSFGFEEIAPYTFNPIVGTVFLALRLGDDRTKPTPAAAPR
jgi:ribosomal protein S18 acetylase RimI-like enzyme